MVKQQGHKNSVPAPLRCVKWLVFQCSGLIVGDAGVGGFLAANPGKVLYAYGNEF
ncbi:MAG: hypothetical protein ACOYNY_15750 [Caldilineaceae bacterium]